MREGDVRSCIVMLLNVSTQNAAVLEQALLDADVGQTTTVSLGHAVALTEKAATRLSQLTAVESIDLSEVYLAPEQLGALLALPRLRHLSIRGGTSWEFDGSLNVFPTLGKAHLEVLVQCCPSHLRVLELAYQEVDASLAATLPQVELRIVP